jgi:hypothetical protein
MFVRLLAVVLWLAWCTLGCAKPAAPSAPSAVLGQIVAFHLPSEQGALVPVPIPGARATLLDVFAPTCAPCAKKVPALLAERAQLAADGVRLVLVAVLADGESTEDAAGALRSWGAESPFLVDRGEVMLRTLAVDKLPASVVLDANGRVRWVARPTSDSRQIAAAAAAVARGGS